MIVLNSNKNRGLHNGSSVFAVLKRLNVRRRRRRSFVRSTLISIHFTKIPEINKADLLDKKEKEKKKEKKEMRRDMELFGSRR